MLNQRETKILLKGFLQKIRLNDSENKAGRDKTAKVGQVLSYLEVVHAQIHKYSKKRELVIIDCGAGNCYLSFVVYYYFSCIEGRQIRIHCLDINERLMDKNRQRARSLGFERIFFHTCDIGDYSQDARPDMVYALHACDEATDKTLFLGLKTGSRNILSVSCCQQALMKSLRGHPYKAITQHSVFKKQLAYMVGDSMRAILLEMNGYEVDIIEFASTRFTDKNIMLRAKRGQAKGYSQLKRQYHELRSVFKLSPVLEDYLLQGDEG